MPSAPAPKRLDQYGDPLPDRALARFGGSTRLRHASVIGAVAVSPDGAIIVSAPEIGGDGVAWLWDAKTGKQLAAFGDRTNPVRCLTFSPDGATLATSSDRAIRLWAARAVLRRKPAHVTPK